MAKQDNFVEVKRKKKSSKFKQAKFSGIINRNDENTNFDFNNFMKRLNNCVAEVELSDFFSQSFEIITAKLYHLKDHNLMHSKISGKNIQHSSTEYVSSHISGEENSKDCTAAVVDRLADIALGKVETQEEPQIHLLSYGIGNFTSSLIARYQLAFLLCLRKNLDMKCKICSVYDPVFSANEKMVLESCGLELINQNEEGCRECMMPTIAFLPHCGRPLYNNLLWANLTSADSLGLVNLLLVGNSLSQIVERTPKGILKNTGNYIIMLQPLAEETSLPDTFIPRDIFNDLAVHLFPQSAIETFLKDVDFSFDKPVYDADDVEFIKK